jgi:hypothetical protein
MQSACARAGALVRSGCVSTSVRDSHDAATANARVTTGVRVAHAARNTHRPAHATTASATASLGGPFCYRPSPPPPPAVSSDYPRLHCPSRRHTFILEWPPAAASRPNTEGWRFWFASVPTLPPVPTSSAYQKLRPVLGFSNPTWRASPSTPRRTAPWVTIKRWLTTFRLSLSNARTKRL